MLKITEICILKFSFYENFENVQKNYYYIHELIVLLLFYIVQREDAHRLSHNKELK